MAHAELRIQRVKLPGVRISLFHILDSIGKETIGIIELSSLQEVAMKTVMPTTNAGPQESALINSIDIEALEKVMDSMKTNVFFVSPEFEELEEL